MMKHTEETKKKISEKTKLAMQNPEIRKKIILHSKGRILSDETRKKISMALKGREFSLEHRIKLSQSSMGNKCSLGRRRSEETKIKDSIAKRGEKNGNFGKIYTKDEREKISIQTTGSRNPFYGHKHTEETIKKMSGQNNHGWLGGKSFEPYMIDWTETLRQSIRERDHYICQMCDMPQSDKAYHVHHIDYDKKNCNPDNLITLCHSCHIKTNSNREYWIKHFKQTLVAIN